MYERLDELFLLFFTLLQYAQFLGQITQAPNYSCNLDNDTIEFTLSASSHSAWQRQPNCSLQQCYLSSSNNNSCQSSATPCFDYRTLNNSRYCAPGILCSILELCNYTTYTCASNSSICIVNSCCSPQPVCLPLLLTNFCILGNETLHTEIFECI